MHKGGGGLGAQDGSESLANSWRLLTSSHKRGQSPEEVEEELMIWSAILGANTPCID